MYKPKIKNIILSAISLVNKRRSNLASSLLIPFILFLLIDLVSLLELPEFFEYVFMILNFMVTTIIAITTHRIMLLGTNFVPKLGLSVWTKRETLFVVHIMLLYAISIGAILSGQFVPLFGLLLGVFVAFYVAACVSLVFPAIAIDQGITFKTSWELTKNHQPLMIVLMIIPPVLYGITSLITKFIPETVWLISIVNLSISVFLIACLSHAYGEIQNYEFKLTMVSN